jgi:ribosomal protein S18 acetylase RimI-like enzyme
MGLAFIEWSAGSGEVDAVVRGREAPRHLMSDALRTLTSWATRRLKLKDIGVRVRSDNTALEFYKKFGFVEDRRVPLRRTEVADGILWSEDASLPPGDPSLVHMHLTES